MIGAIAGDIIGSAYEFNNVKTKDFPLFGDCSSYTDDSIMTVAVADWLLHGGELAKVMQHYGNKYPDPMGGYGGRFAMWLHEVNPKPYNSWGNGAAMRVSPVGWYFDSLEETLRVAKETAIITHNHPEGIKGAQAVAGAIFLARNEKSKEYIKEFVEKSFGYDLNRNCDDIRLNYEFDESCQGTVPEAIIAFLESRDFEDAIRLAVSLGGDSDTLACITGGIAEAFYKYGMPCGIRDKVRILLDDDLWRIVEEFVKARHEWFVHPRWEDDGNSLALVVSNPPKEEVERLKKASFEAITTVLNTRSNESEDQV
ncbi:ADP-ribosylglycohydrolase family protein [Phocaeicola sp.]